MKNKLSQHTNISKSILGSLFAMKIRSTLTKEQQIWIWSSQRLCPKLFFKKTFKTKSKLNRNMS